MKVENENGRRSMIANELPAVEFLRVMALAREGDRREGILLRQGKGWFQVGGTGHEAIGALAYLLRPDDYLYVTYRDRALVLARGVSNYEIALGYLGKQDSSSLGRQMPSHFSSARMNILSTATPTAIQCVPAAGTAWAAKLRNTDTVTLCTIGDASIRQGDFYEAVCFAAQERLPVVFVVEDNGYGISTPTAGMNPWNLGVLSNEHTVRVNGRDAFEVFEAGRTAVERARRGMGPTVLWCELDRLASHTSSDDHRLYRPAHEIEAMMQRDPLDLLRDRLAREGRLDLERWEEELERIVVQVDADYQRAEMAPDPDTRRAEEHTFSSEPLPRATANLAEQEHWTMVGAVNETLRRALSEDGRVVVFGEDVEDPKGGVFGLTKGLSSAFPNRVFNSPLAECTIAGTAAGLAAAGMKPVFEIQFIDFVGPAFNQIVNQMATARWRTGGDWNCPVVLLAPCGAYLPSGGPWHSQTNEAWFAHAPGLRVAMPSTPHDAAALINAALAGDDPTLILLPKHMFRQKFGVADEAPKGFGEAAVRREGEDVTVVAWGNTVELALEAAERAAQNDISLEVLDLRTIVPCDWTAIRESLAKTGRLVVVQEDNRTCSFGQAILAELNSKPETWDLFGAPPVLLSRPDAHIGYHAALEEAVLPSVEDIVNAVRTLMNY